MSLLSSASRETYFFSSLLSVIFLGISKSCVGSREITLCQSTNNANRVGILKRGAGLMGCFLPD